MTIFLITPRNSGDTPVGRQHSAAALAKVAAIADFPALAA
jgi:hypothetical protein